MSKKESKNLIVITGPSAIGKTGLAVFLARHLQCEILSFDSRQFYKEMCIGTAIPSEQELNSAKHHFIQHKSIHEDYTVGDFEKDALKKLKELFKEKDIVIFVGGSGLYERAVTEGLDEFPEIDKSIREELIQKLENEGIEVLQNELKEVDPDYYEKVDIYNPQRIIRALEIYRGTGKAFSSFHSKKEQKRDFNVIKIGLNLPREEVYNRINRRVDLMIEKGLLKEVESLYPYKDLNALQTVGYKELFDFFEGKTELENAIEEIKKNTRRYAKRQLTWLRKDENINWFSPYESEKILKFIIKSV